MTIAKSLGSGFPVAALMAREEIADVFEQGTHGSTFGGNPMAMAAALAVLRILEEEGLCGHARVMGDYFRKHVADLCKDLDTIKEVRGLGLMIGIELTHPGAGVVKECAARGLLVNCTMGNVIRLLPPLVVTEKDCDQAAAILAEVLRGERELQLKDEQQTGEVS